jgi:8-oxo-dGTP pyrophosphatase MutT (NUDIX family)
VASEPSPELIDVSRVRTALSKRSPAARDSASTARAAVAVVLRDANQGAEVLLIRRAERERDPWSGHMALPGGRSDPDDADPLATALRETREEVGLDLRQAAMLLGGLDELPAMSRGRPIGLTITPFVFELVASVELTLNDEVVEALWAPLGPLARGEHHAVKRYLVEGATIDLPAWDIEGRIVWGLTYRMLQELLALVR